MTATEQQSDPQRYFLEASSAVGDAVARYRSAARTHFYEVLLERFRCPNCANRMQFLSGHAWTCRCGERLDPALAFGNSACCGLALRRKQLHYACSGCGRDTPSAFLFDERVYDAEYFREKMREVRAKKRGRAATKRLRQYYRRSGSALLEIRPAMDAIPGLERDLAGFIGGGVDSLMAIAGDAFDLAAYKDHVRRELRGERLFRQIPALRQPNALDMARRLLTVLFMENDGELTLTQYGRDLLVAPR